MISEKWSWFRIAPVVLAVLAVLPGCNVPADHEVLKQGSLPPLLSAHRFAFRGTLLGGYQVSPDGSKLAWTGPSFGRTTLFVRYNDSGKISEFRAPSGGYLWTSDGRRLLYTSDTTGAENTHVYMLDLDGGDAQAVDLTPYPGVRAAIHRVLATDPEHVLVYHNRRDSKLFDLYRINVNTRKETLVAQNPGDAVAPLTASDGEFNGWTKSRDAQRPAAERRQPQSVRRPALIKKPDETFRALGVSADRSQVWALSDRGRDRLALVAAHPTLGWEKVVFDDPAVDVAGVTMSRITQAPLIATAQPGYPRTAILDATLRDDLDVLMKEQGDAPYGLAIVSMDDAEKRLVISVSTSTQRRYYFVDRTRRTHVLLSEAVPQDIAEALSPMRPVTITSRDGLTLHGYLTLPRGVEPRRLPMVLFVHGGPWQRTYWSDPFDVDNSIYVHFLANRGYAVLQVDFRGSTGYGHRFASAGYGEFAGKMQDDLLDAVQWAADSGIADRDRIAIMGYSYGGYAALVGMAMTPEVFACGVSLAGPTDLASMIESFPPYWTDLSIWHDYVGDPAIPADREQMQLKSPLTHAKEVRRPVLIVHGAKDVRVRIDQAERMVQALKEGGKPVEYLAIDEMGHAMGYWVHRLAILRRSEVFLQRCLGGRASRFDPFDAVAWVWTRIRR